MKYKARRSETQADLDKIIRLRYEILRKPWKQTFESASDEYESVSVNALVEDEGGNVVACGRLQQLDDASAQIRYMAVGEQVRGQGLGKEILSFLEDEARKMGLKKVILQARENALDFYTGRGYATKEKSFLLWGLIQHYLMEKVL